MNKIFVCTKCYVQKNILLDILKIFYFMLGFLEESLVRRFYKMMIWGATEQSKESFLVSIITLQDTSIR